MDLEKWKEQWSDLCRGTRKLAGDMGEAAWTGALKAGQAAENAIRYTRLKARVLDLGTQVRSQMRKIGELVYATHSRTPTDSATLQAALEAVDKLNEEIDECQRALAALRGIRICGVCGAENRAADSRCTQCGQPLDY